MSSPAWSVSVPPVALKVMTALLLIVRSSPRAGGVVARDEGHAGPDGFVGTDRQWAKSRNLSAARSDEAEVVEIEGP